MASSVNAVRQYAKIKIRRSAVRHAQRGRPVDEALASAAKILLEDRKRCGGRLGPLDEDGSWAADLAIEAWEEATAAREPVKRQRRNPVFEPIPCLTCGQPFMPGRSTAKFCCKAHRHTWHVRNWRAKKAAA